MKMSRHMPPSPAQLEYAPPQARSVAHIERIEEVVERIRPKPIEGLDEVALQLRTLPYGMFMEFSEAIGAPPGKLWEWATERRIRL